MDRSDEVVDNFKGTADAAGRLVRDLMDATTATGVTTLRWDGLNRAGRAVPSGVYFLKVSSAGVTRTHKLVVLK